MTKQRSAVSGVDVYFVSCPEGRPVSSDVIPVSGISGLSFGSSFLSALFFFCLVSRPITPVLTFSANGVDKNLKQE